MKSFPVKNTGAPLTVLFAGWGMDETPFADFDAGACDFVVCYDYTSLDLDERVFAGREVRRVLAWSLGVWAAATLFGRIPALANAPQKIAINGTATPIDDACGIPQAVFDGTLAGLSAETLARFERRMCQDPATLAFYNSRRPKRTLESLRAELAAIGEAVMRAPSHDAHFTHAIIGMRDAIFPPRNQLAAWSADSQKTNIAQTDSPHYSDTLLRNAIYGHNEQKR